MDKRTLLAVVLSAAVMYFFSVYSGTENPKQTVDVSAQKQETVTTSASTTSTGKSSVTSSTNNSSTFSDKHEVRVETDLFSAVFSSRGASLKSLTLKKYNEDISTSSMPVILGADADPNISNYSTQATGFNLPVSTIFTSNADSLKLNGKESQQLTFNYVSNQGFTVRKIYTITGDSYGIKLETQVFNNSQAALVGNIQHIMTYPAQYKKSDSRFESAGSYLVTKNSLEITKTSDVEKASKKFDSNVLWAGFADKFFICSILAENGSIASVDVKKNQAGFLESITSSPQLTINPGQSAKIVNSIFVGPKDIDVLKSQGHSLDKSLDLGWFDFLAMPLLHILKFFNNYFNNYGVAIIIITVIIKIIFIPLTHKSYKSMKDMQKIQPKMAELKERYKNDRDTMNRAVMELYREHKVNPLGGCLPMIVQIPVFFALYKALMYAIELRHAHFFMWINDLSGPDNLFGQMLGLPFVLGPLPLIMGVSMYFQQKLTPTSGDPLQQKVLLMLPVVFTVMFLSFPSGLVLYWLVNNVLTIAQQIYINKYVS